MLKKALFLLLAGGATASGQHTPLTLWYRQPAEVWTEALPVGNGRLGAMVFGRVSEELIQLNEGTFWSGGPMRQSANPDAWKQLPAVREALAAEDYAKATALLKKMQGRYTQSYLPLGDLIIKQNVGTGAPTAYSRELDLDRAVAATRFTVDGQRYTREIFASQPDNVIAIRLTGTQNLSFSVSGRSKILFERVAEGNNELIIKGKAPSNVHPNYYNPKGQNPVTYDGDCAGMRYQFRIRVISKGAKITADTSGIRVSGAKEALLLVSAATSFNGFDKCPDTEGRDENKLASEAIRKAAALPYATLQKKHITDYQSFFHRFSFRLKDTLANRPDLPANERLQAYSGGAYDPGLETLYFQYGRYLLIACSRPGNPAANLQGLWNKELRAPWSSNYTININTQMNYWPAEPTNLSDLHAPLFDLIKNLSVVGKGVAKEYYNLNGWVAHHNTDIWALANPVGDVGHGDPKWANWNEGAAWLCQHLYEHYRFTKDRAFLRDVAYPLMKEAAVFSMGYLVEDKNGYLVTSPSTSPENAFLDKNGKPAFVTVGSTMDMSIIHDLFTNLIEAADALGTDAAFKSQLVEKKNKLLPLHIGRKGNLQEWYGDWEDEDPHHRHVSHLFALHPGRRISPVESPEFAAAARKTLELRGDEGTGWSKAWKINFWARLLDGNHAYSLIRQLLHYTRENGTDYQRGGGTYPNFFDAHPPFQIDGNFGGTAGMTEMLVQSHLSDIHLLAAMPDAWANGEVSGLRARGGFDIAMKWNGKKLTTATVVSRAGDTCRIRTASPLRLEGAAARSVQDAHGYLLVFPTAAGKTYRLLPE